ncbi:MAG TPA: hypothetical protein ENN44_06895 [Methanoculleus sp.]|nr:hypothetical protein [Methanoculleus sp.]
MATLDVPRILYAAATILIREDRRLSVEFREGEIRIKFPTTRRLAEYLNVPHYYVLPYFSEMEENNMIRREERVGISTTTAGTSLFFSMLDENLKASAETLLGSETFEALGLRARACSGEQRESRTAEIYR